MKKIKLPLEMANGVIVRTLDELKENWDLEKIVGYFGDGRLLTWLSDRYYSDLAEKVQKITATGAEAQKQLCAVFGMEFKQDEVVDAEALAERKRKLDILRQFTSDDEILKNVDSVAFNQEDLADLLDEGVEKIYLCNSKFVVPLTIANKEYVGLGNVEVYIGKDEWIDFDKLGIKFKDVKFDAKYAEVIEKVKMIRVNSERRRIAEEEERKKQEEIRKKEEEERKKKLNSKKIGDIIKIGMWDGEIIEWEILEISDEKCLVISEYALDYRPYNNHKMEVTWANCSLRKWLNNEFFLSAFDENVQQSIIESRVVAHPHPNWSTMHAGNDTNDKVFLLSVTEAKKYFGDYHVCTPTNCAMRNGARVKNGSCDWWLRTPGGNYYNAAYHGMSGCGYCFVDGSTEIGPTLHLSDTGSYMRQEEVGFYRPAVRPAMWVDLSKL